MWIKWSNDVITSNQMTVHCPFNCNYYLLLTITIDIRFECLNSNWGTLKSKSAEYRISTKNQKEIFCIILLFCSTCCHTHQKLIFIKWQMKIIQLSTHLVKNKNGNKNEKWKIENSLSKRYIFSRKCSSLLFCIHLISITRCVCVHCLSKRFFYYFSTHIRPAFGPSAHIKDIRITNFHFNNVDVCSVFHSLYSPSLAVVLFRHVLNHCK